MYRFQTQHGILALMFIVLLSACASPKQATVAPPQPPVVSTTVAINIFTSLQNDSLLQNAHVGIAVFDIDKQQYIHQYNSNKFFIPASNTKLFTTYAALKYLGDSLTGIRYYEDDYSIVLQGTGDPTLLHPLFDNQPVYNFLKTKNKSLSLDTTNWNENRIGNGWSWDDFGEAYCTERSSFPIYGNSIHFFFEDSQLRSVPQYSWMLKVAQPIDRFPNYPKLHIKNIGSKINIARVTPDNELFQITPSSSTFNGKTLPRKINEYEHLALLNDTLNGTQNGKDKAIYYERYYGNNINTKGFPQSIKSQPTDSVVKPMMFESDNFLAEHLLLTVSNQRFNTMNEAAIIDTLLKNDLKDLPQRPRWVDGSGMSRYNLFSPSDFVFLLNKMKQEFPWNRLTTVLPTGNQGSLRNYYTNYTNRIFAKTGSMSNNITLSGYIITKQNKTLAFSLLVNNHQVNSNAIRRAFEKYLIHIIDNY